MIRALELLELSLKPLRYDLVHCVLQFVQKPVVSENYYPET